MNAPTTDFRVPSSRRRMILAGLGAGMCAAVVGALRWPRTDSAGTPGQRSTRPSAMADAERNPIQEAANDISLASTPMSREWFLPHLRDPFDIEGHGPMRLIEISPATALHNGAIAYTAFTLLFEAPENCDTPEGIHRLRHATLGEMDLFLTPVGRPAARTCYEAAFTLKS